MLQGLCRKVLDAVTNICPSHLASLVLVGEHIFVVRRYNPSLTGNDQKLRLTDVYAL